MLSILSWLVLNPLKNFCHSDTESTYIRHIICGLECYLWCQWGSWRWLDLCRARWPADRARPRKSTESNGLDWAGPKINAPSRIDPRLHLTVQYFRYSSSSNSFIWSWIHRWPSDWCHVSYVLYIIFRYFLMYFLELLMVWSEPQK